jgi:HTH-type transcriptional regulator / antitoxin HipB
MYVRTPTDIGLLIRDRRRQLGLSQTELAGRVGVGRQWIVAIEQGKARAELGLVMRALASLDLRLSINASDAVLTPDGTTPIDLDAIIDAAKGN